MIGVEGRVKRRTSIEIRRQVEFGIDVKLSVCEDIIGCSEGLSLSMGEAITDGL